MGELRETPRTLNIEKFELVEMAASFTKVANPPCPSCGKNMKSIGKGQGYRCRGCGTKATAPLTKREERPIAPGWHEPPVCARRHLSKPLKRMLPPIDQRRSL
jgi:tRNA(Ile2)-agmatinylcytidine synthase